MAFTLVTGEKPMRKSITSALVCVAVAACSGTSRPGGVHPEQNAYVEIVRIENALVFFDPGSAQLNRSAIENLDRYEPAMWFQGVDQVDITGHTDRTGSAADNLRLSLRRAEAVRDALIARGASETLFVVHGAGETDLMVPTADGVAAPQNRRVEILPGTLKQDSARQ
jgi:outer membrane protein OmpA-like peptidoglycan-associated protein